jgi:hypothetical protein
VSLFKKKKTEPAILTLLYNIYKRAREDGKTCFYFALFDSDKKYAEQFCKKNHLRMELDHTTDGNLIYKFTILGE